LRTCAKCGKANDVTRKFCVRCGASLLVAAEPAKPKISSAVPELGRVTTEASFLGAKEAEETADSEGLSGTEKAGFVRPTEVQRDRLRTAERHTEKTEFEKAQEAFARSETAKPEERMLRASQVRDLGAEVDEETEGFASTEEPPVETTTDKGMAKTAEVTSEEGKEALRLVLEKVTQAEALAKKEAAAPRLEPSLEVPDRSAPEAEAERTLPEEVTLETTMGSSVEKTPVSMPEERRIERPLSSMAAAVVPTTEEEYLSDEKIRKIEIDIKSFNVERQQLQSDLDKLHTRLDAEVERYRTAAYVKRTRTESIERDLRLAKKEWDDADKEYKNAESHRKKELSTAEKRIDDVDKRTRKAEEAKSKRIEEIDKEKEKRLEESKKT